MGNWQDWSSWLREGYYISYMRGGIRYYEHIVARDLGRWVYDWPETIASEEESGPYVPPLLEITKGYNKDNNTNRIWQMIFGIKGQVYIYIELPTDLHRHGIPKVVKPRRDMRQVGHFEEWMSPFIEPSFLTEHFLMRPNLNQIGFDAWNPNEISITDLQLNIFIAKMVTERIGTYYDGELTPTSERWASCLDRLYRRLIPHRPITMLPVQAPAEAVG